MPRQFKVTVNGREYDVTVLELTAGQAAQSPGPAPAAVAAAGSATSAAPSAAAPQQQATAAAGAGDEVAGMGGVVVEVDVKGWPDGRSRRSAAGTRSDEDEDTGRCQSRRTGDPCPGFARRPGGGRSGPGDHRLSWANRREQAPAVCNSMRRRAVAALAWRED
jgi:hypothetical protein